jgi:hypothetical protein
VNLAERVLAIHHALEEATIEHAIGGALALAYWTQEPRGTRDIDVNVFVAPEDGSSVLRALPRGIAHDEATLDVIRRDGQVRLWWDDTPVDLFFSNLPIHDAAAHNRRKVPFEGEEIPVLAPLELALFKAMFDRTRDWADIEEMLIAKSFDPAQLKSLIEAHVGDDDPRLGKLANAIAQGSR